MTGAEFEAHILPCHRKMYATAMVITGDGDEASDLVQEAFARLWEKRGEIPDPENPEGYCVTVVKRMSIDRLRRRKTMPQVPIEEVAPPSDTAPERTLDAADELKRLTSLMERLPASQREVLHLSAVAGMDNAEIEKATGLTSVNVRALLSRGRRQLKKLFEKENR